MAPRALVGIAALATGLSGGTVQAAGRQFKFDMGTAQSPVWPGCTKVTKETTYSPARGYGWQTKSRLFDCHRVPVGTGGKRSIPDDLWGDFVFSPGPNAFRLDLSNGRYQVVILIGDTGSVYGPYTTKVRSLYPIHSIIIKANGRQAISEIITPDNLLDYWYQNLHTEYRRGDCPWRKYVDPKFQPRSFEVKVSDGKLLLDLSGDCRVAGLFVHPVGQSAAFKKWYDAQTPARRKFFLDRYDQIPHDPLYPPAEPTAEERARGYLLFSRSYLQDIFPNSNPAADERRIDLNIFAARGEYETVTFSVVPIRSLKTARVTVSDLSGPGGATIPATAWEVRHVRYMQVPRHSIRNVENPYSVQGRLLDRRRTQDFEAGTTRRVWLTVQVPRVAAAGLYKGKITFRPGNAPAAVLPLTLRVLPFELGEPKDVAIGIFYNPGSPWRKFPKHQDRYWADVRSSLKLLREHGFTSVSFSIDRPRVWIDQKDGKIRADLSKFDRFFEVFKQVGMSMTAPFCTYGYDGGSGLVPVQPTYRMGWIASNGERADEYLAPEWIKRFRELLRYQADYGKKHGWPPLVYCVHDEVHGWSRKRLEGTARIIETTYMAEPEVKTTGCINTPEGKMLVGYHDYPMFNTGVPFNQENLEMVRKAGKTVTIDNFGQNRWSIGFWMWRVQPKLAADSFFCWIGSDPYNPFDNATASELAVALPAPDGWIPTPTLPRMREGIDDYKYAYTLQQALSEAAKGGNDSEPIRRGRETLRYLRRITDVRLKRYYTDGLPSQEACDSLRYRLARDIAALAGAEVPAPRVPPPNRKWWDDSWGHRVAMDFQAGMYTRHDGLAMIELDLAALAKKAGLDAIDAGSLRIVEAAGDLDPVPFDRQDTDAGTIRLIWRVAGRTPALATRRFYLYFEAPAAKKPPRPADLVLNLAEPLPMLNLLHNGGFEQVRPGTRLPAGWDVPPPDRLTRGHIVAVTTREKVSGRRALRFVQNGKVDRKKSYPHARHPPVAILPGRKYRLSGWIKRAKGSSYNEIMLRWRGDRKQRLGNRKFDAYTKGRHDWLLAEATGLAPPNAHFAEINVSVYPFTAPGTGYFDDIRLVLLPKDGHPLGEVRLGRPETKNQAPLHGASGSSDWIKRRGRH